MGFLCSNFQLGCHSSIKRRRGREIEKHTLGASAKATAGEKAIPPRAAAASGAKR
jgi:hypothetical protein